MGLKMHITWIQPGYGCQHKYAVYYGPDLIDVGSGSNNDISNPDTRACKSILRRAYDSLQAQKKYMGV